MKMFRILTKFWRFPPNFHPIQSIPVVPLAPIIFATNLVKVIKSGVIGLGLSDHDLIYCARKTSLP